MRTIASGIVVRLVKVLRRDYLNRAILALHTGHHPSTSIALETANVALVILITSAAEVGSAVWQIKADAPRSALRVLAQCQCRVANNCL
jgi:hypothetical protein